MYSARLQQSHMMFLIFDFKNFRVPEKQFYAPKIIKDGIEKNTWEKKFNVFEI